MRIVIILLGAFVLDLLFGDPAWIYHPICLIGKLIAGTEKWIRPRVKNQLVAGGIMAVWVMFVCFIVPALLLVVANLLHPILGFVLELFWCFQILATTSLRKAALAVYQPLKIGDLAEARKQVSYIVGRDTQDLTRTGVIKATVETVAENTTDGVVAPLLFMAIGGAPLGFLYKSINTMDSMVGYKNETYLLFGRVAAKIDDAANFIPARLTALLMVGSAYLLKEFDGKRAWNTFKRDRKNHKSPNAGQTESVCAGALGVQLAGDAVYFGEHYEKPTIGDDLRPIEEDDIPRANRLLYGTAILSLVCGVLLRWLVVSILW